jgi:hypothetical protein
MTSECGVFSTVKNLLNQSCDFLSHQKRQDLDLQVLLFQKLNEGSFQIRPHRA